MIIYSKMVYQKLINNNKDQVASAATPLAMKKEWSHFEKYRGGVVGG